MESKSKTDHNELPVPLPGTITALKIQKNNPERVSVFVDDQFLLGVSQNAILEFDLKKGKTISPALFKTLSRIDSVSKLEQYFLRLLARRMYLSADLYKKARQKEYDEAIISSVIQKFTDKGWLDDRAYALAFARDKYNLNKWGPYKVKSALQAKGLPSKLVSEAVDEIFDKANSRKTLEQLVNKRKRHFLREGNLLKRKKKISDYLLRKGFPSESIQKHLDYLMEMIKR